MYRRVATDHKNIIEIKRSQFITHLIPISDSQDAEEKLAIVTKSYSDATHNCYAYIANDIATVMRFSDDGEPQGTAGQPILEILKKRGIYLTLAVVTRYFGGVKLGASGLIGAYTQSVVEALDTAEILEFHMSDIAELSAEYSMNKMIGELIVKYKGKVLDCCYDQLIKYKFAIPTISWVEFDSEIINLSCGRVAAKKLTQKYIAY